MGFLIVQDIAVVIALMVLGSLREAPDLPVLQVAAITLAKLAAAAALVFVAPAASRSRRAARWTCCSSPSRTPPTRRRGC